MDSKLDLGPCSDVGEEVDGEIQQLEISEFTRSTQLTRPA